MRSTHRFPMYLLPVFTTTVKPIALPYKKVSLGQETGRIVLVLAFKTRLQSPFLWKSAYNRIKIELLPVPAPSKLIFEGNCHDRNNSNLIAFISGPIFPWNFTVVPDQTADLSKIKDERFRLKMEKGERERRKVFASLAQFCWSSVSRLAFLNRGISPKIPSLLRY